MCYLWGHLDWGPSLQEWKGWDPRLGNELQLHLKKNNRKSKWKWPMFWFITWHLQNTIWVYFLPLLPNLKPQLARSCLLLQQWQGALPTRGGHSRAQCPGRAGTQLDVVSLLGQSIWRSVPLGCRGWKINISALLHTAEGRVQMLQICDNHESLPRMGKLSPYTLSFRFRALPPLWPCSYTTRTRHFLPAFNNWVSDS